ncbi:MAG: helix-turn-helix domain-containing protein [Flavobacteriaceae bacterium]|jgi:ribosome-binding protein aMBF1 (putative translation factor)|nr:helix-turn-helix domain-containing protein [Flavobacteriaceae bacterium]
MKIRLLNIHILNNIAINIKKFRSVSTISIEKLCEKTNISPRIMSKINKGLYTKLTILECEKIAFVLKIKIEELVT